MLKTSPIVRWAIYVLLVLCALFFLSPLVYIFLNSFKPAGEIFQVPQSVLPKEWTLENYSSLFRSGMSDFFVTSVFITVFGVILVALLSSLAGYGFAKLPFPGANLVLMAIVATLTIPLVIFLVPMFLMENATGLLNTRLGLLLPNVAVALPFAILIMRAAFMGIPKEVEESAIMDGAGALRRWWLVMLPMARNGVVLVVIMTAYGGEPIRHALVSGPNAAKGRGLAVRHAGGSDRRRDASPTHHLRHFPETHRGRRRAGRGQGLSR